MNTIIETKHAHLVITRRMPGGYEFNGLMSQRNPSLNYALELWPQHIMQLPKSYKPQLVAELEASR